MKKLLKSISIILLTVLMLSSNIVLAEDFSSQEDSENINEPDRFNEAIEETDESIIEEEVEEDSSLILEEENIEIKDENIEFSTFEEEYVDFNNENQIEEIILLGSGNSEPEVVYEGVDFESDIIYKTHFDTPNITVIGDPTAVVFKDFDRLFTRDTNTIVMSKDAEAVEVDYGVVGTIKNHNVVLKLKFSDFVYWPYMSYNATSDYYYKEGYMQILVGNNPTTGFVLDDIYLCKVTYDMRYEDGTLLDTPSLTLDSLNNQTREGAKPINAYKVSVSEDTIMDSMELQLPFAIANYSVDPSYPDIDEDLTVGWWYDTEALVKPDETFSQAEADYIYNPLSGKVDAYNPRTAITCFYEDSSNMQAWITTRNSGVWESAKVVAKEVKNNLTIKKETNIDSSEKFNFKIKIWREIVSENIEFVNIDEPTNQAYAVYNSSDRSLTFFRDENNKYTNGQVLGTETYYTNFEYTAGSAASVPWSSKRSSVEQVIFNDIIIPNRTDSWFNNMTNVTTFKGLENLRLYKLETAVYMFANCSSLTELDTSSFYAPNLRRCGSMFAGCSNLTFLDLSGMDFSYFLFAPSSASYAQNDASGFTWIFKDCSKLSTVLYFPVSPINNSEPFIGAATASGAEIKLKIWRIAPYGQKIVSYRTTGRLESLLRGAGNVTYELLDERYVAPLPSYLSADTITFKSENHIFDLLNDPRFTYDLDSQEYSFSLFSGESITIEDIPKGYNYKIYEIDVDGNEVEIGANVNDTFVLFSEENAEGTIGEDITATFFNQDPNATKEVQVYKYWDSPSEEFIPDNLQLEIITNSGDTYSNIKNFEKQSNSLWIYTFEIPYSQQIVDVNEEQLDNFVKTHQFLDEGIFKVYNAYTLMPFSIAVFTREQYEQVGNEYSLLQEDDVKNNVFNVYDSEMNLVKSVTTDKESPFYLEYDPTGEEVTTYYLEHFSTSLDNYVCGKDLIKIELEDAYSVFSDPFSTDYFLGLIADSYWGSTYCPYGAIFLIDKKKEVLTIEKEIDDKLNPEDEWNFTLEMWKEEPDKELICMTKNVEMNSEEYYLGYTMVPLIDFSFNNVEYKKDERYTSYVSVLNNDYYSLRLMNPLRDDEQNIIAYFTELPNGKYLIAETNEPAYQQDDRAVQFFVSDELKPFHSNEDFTFGTNNSYVKKYVDLENNFLLRHERFNGERRFYPHVEGAFKSYFLYEDIRESDKELIGSERVSFPGYSVVYESSFEPFETFKLFESKTQITINGKLENIYLDNRAFINGTDLFTAYMYVEKNENNDEILKESQFYNYPVLVQGYIEYPELDNESLTKIEDGKWTFKLKASETIEIEVPTGFSYRVTEDVSNQQYKIKTYVDEVETTITEGIVKENEDIYHLYRNTMEVHDLTVKKIVSGNMGNKTQKFDFEIRVENLEENYLDLSVFELQPTTDDWYSLTLSNEESFTLNDLPSGYTYEVREKDYSTEGYTTTIDGVAGNYISGKVESEDILHTFNNKNSVVIPTGIKTLGIVPVSVVLITLIIFFRKQKKS